MDEEKENLNLEDETADEQEFDAEEESDLDETDDEEPGEEEQEEKAEEPEIWDSEEDFLKQHGLPGDPKSIDEVVVGYKEAVRRMNELQRQIASRPEPEKKPQTGHNDGEPETFYKVHAVSSFLKNLEESGQIDPETAKNVRSWAGTIDRAFEDNWKKATEVQSTLARAVDRIAKQMRRQSWSSFQHQDLVRREDLDQLMDSMGLLDYNEALTFKVSQDPDLLAKFASKQQKIGESKGRQKQKKMLKRFSGPRRSGPPSSGDKVWKNFVVKGTMDLDEAKLNRLPTDKRSKVVDAYLKDFGKK